MTHKRRNILILLILAFFVFCIGVVIFIFTQAGKERSVSLYYKNLAQNNIELETRVISDKDIASDSQLMEIVLRELAAGPKTNASLMGVFDDVEIAGFSLDSDARTAYVDLSKEYFEKTLTDRLLIKASLVYSLTALGFVDNVIITADGMEAGDLQPLNRKNILLDPDIAPEKINYRTMTLYFTDSKGEYLYGEQRLLELKQSQDIEYQIVEQLLSGPENANLVSPIPSSTKLINTTTENGICYVNLSSAFLNKGSSSGVNKLQIYSIVNSLTALDNVDQVQFYIDGQKVTDSVGEVDISKELSGDESLIKEQTS